MTTFTTAQHNGIEAVKRVQREQGRTVWTKADYELLAAMQSAALRLEIENDDCEIEKRAFRAKFGRVA